MEVLKNIPIDKEFCTAFGGHLRKLRQKKGMSIKELAAAVDITPSKLSRVERGEAGLLVTSIFHLAEALDLPPRKLVMFKWPPESNGDH